MVKSDHFNFFAIFKMAADAILNYAKACKVPVRDSLDLDSRHIKLPFHKFSAIYIFFPFDNLKKSNDLGLLIKMTRKKTRIREEGKKTSTGFMGRARKYFLANLNFRS